MKYTEEKMKFCEKHNQQYLDFLPECPICRGEKMVKPPLIIKIEEENK